MKKRHMNITSFPIRNKYEINSIRQVFHYSKKFICKNLLILKRIKYIESDLSDQL